VGQYILGISCYYHDSAAALIKSEQPKVEKDETWMQEFELD
jgi:predicted NodU family carbamoyl transferase|tara:strand:- start:172 stop:294 length:123 start_codon:yes stop_codon:yes gene_type:complete